MADKLLVRAYDVELGDCIYCRIPRARKSNGAVDDFHVLIDCGSKGGIKYLESALADLRGLLPHAGGGKRRLDLLAVTHEHSDHIAGFGPKLFEGFQIEHIWMSGAMDPQHPQAGRALRLHRLATVAMRNLASQNLSLSPELAELVALYGVDNDTAMETLRDVLPDRNGISPTYVHAGMTGAQLGLPLSGASIRVLGPEKDVDRFYLGEEADESLQGLLGTGAAFRGEPAQAATTCPANISRSDFRRLQSRMVSSAFAFAELSSKVTNNTSLVLLLEWSGKRLLFVGDAEWETTFKEGKANGAWNVMWHQRRAHLAKPLDFLKVGHHGSENATPWNDLEDGEITEPGAILDAILPLPQGNARPTACAVVSTRRKPHPTIPRSALLAVLGKRVRNVRHYGQAFGAEASKLPRYQEHERQWLGEPQPWRTDFENALSGARFVDVEIEA